MTSTYVCATRRKDLSADLGMRRFVLRSARIRLKTANPDVFASSVFNRFEIERSAPLEDRSLSEGKNSALPTFA